MLYVKKSSLSTFVLILFLFITNLNANLSTITPTCNLSNGLVLTTYDISNYTQHYPNNNNDFINLETNYATDTYKFNTGVVENINTTGRNNNPYGADEHYLSIFKGYIYVPTPGVYSFAVNGDDAVEVTFNDSEYLGWYGGHGSDTTTHNQNFTFNSKGYYKIKFRHQEWTGGDSYQLYWKKPGENSYNLVPKASLFYCDFAKPIASYQFEDCYYHGTLNEVKDDIGLYHGTSINGMISKYSSEKNDMFGRVAKFDGIDDYVALPTFPNLTGSRTITAWFKTMDNTKPGQRIFADDETNGNGNYAISLGDPGAGMVRFYIRGLSSISLDSKSVIQNNKWYFMAATFDVNTKEKTLKIYDEFGVLKDSVSVVVRGTVGVPSGMASIGGETNSGETNNRFKGSIDKVLIYQNVLTQVQIEEVLNNNLSKKQYNGIDIPRYKICPVVNYRLDDLCNSGGSSFRVAESTGSNLVGIIKPNSNSLVSRQGKVCTGAEFNGVDEYISVDDSDVLDNTQTLTTTAWIYPTELFQSNGTNARGLFSKRNNPSSQYAYGVFFWNGHNQNSTEAAVYVDIDSNNDRTYSTGKVKVNEWTHITITFDGRLPQNERMKIYINGALDSTHSESSSFIPDYSSDFHIGNLYTGTNKLKVFQGIMDEVKIYDQALNSADIATLYSRENSGLDYAGSFRNCICSIMKRNATFNAVDSLGGCFKWDNKIQTKKIDTNIDLMILSRDDNNTAVPDANITKVELLNYSDVGCSNLIETKEIWTGNHLTNDGQSGCFDLPLFSYNKASRCSQIRIYGILDSNEINSTATDNFAIRPDKFNLTLPAVGYAGENFNIDFNATNGQDYNETLNSSFLVESNISKSVCFNAPLHVAPFSFIDGVKSVDANYSDVGDINVTIKEILGSEFAVVDYNDTVDADRLITPNTQSITIKPYELNVTNIVYDEGWLYMADVNNIYQELKFSVIANDMQHNIVQNFTENCYAQDVDVKTNFAVDNNNNNVEVKYDDNTTVDIGDINRTITIPKALFINSKADVNYSFNIVRDYKTPYAPITIGLREINIQSNNVAKEENNATVSLDRDFYYGKIKTEDLSTNLQTASHALHVEVYKVDKFRQSSLNWYINEDDSNTTVSFAPKSDFSYATDKSGVNITNIAQMSSGVIKFNITNTWSSSDGAMIHVDIPLWLWYSKYNPYNLAVDCGSHPCFEYRYLDPKDSTGIESGDFKGSSIGSDYNATKQKIGVKTFR